MKRKLPSQRILNEQLRYNKTTGVVYWRYASRTRKANTRAGSYRSRNQYRQIYVCGALFYEHRLIWKMVTGRDPTNEIDHINRRRDDNRWKNLREANGTQNQANASCPKHNTSGYKGASFDKSRKNNPWIASLSLNNKTKRLGRFASAQEAHLAYCYAAKKYFGEFARHA